MKPSFLNLFQVFWSSSSTRNTQAYGLLHINKAGSLTLIFPLYSMKPSFLNFLMKKFTRARVAPVDRHGGQIDPSSRWLSQPLAWLIGSPWVFSFERHTPRVWLVAHSYAPEPRTSSENRLLTFRSEHLISPRILYRQSIFLRQNGAGLSGFAILDSNKVE